MKIAELQKLIIQKVLDTTDTELLDYMNELLSNSSNTSVYKLSDTEKKLVKESMSEYTKGHVVSGDEVEKRNNKWLEE